MSRLDGSGEWLERLAQRSRFLEICAQEANDLSQRFRAPLPVEAAEALTRDVGREASANLVRIDLLLGAAELAFCTDETGRALKLIQSALTVLKDTPRFMMFLARQAYFGVLTGKEEIAVEGFGLRMSGFEAPWTSIVTADALVRNLTPLVLAGLASGPPEENTRIVMTGSEADTVSRSARLAYMASSDAALLGLFGVARPRHFSFFDSREDVQTYKRDSLEPAFAEARRSGLAALEMLEYGYQRRIDLLQSNVVAWKSVAPKTSMIDWPLLMVHLALLRRQRASVLTETPSIGGAVQFIRDLAKELFLTGSRPSDLFT